MPLLTPLGAEKTKRKEAIWRNTEFRDEEIEVEKDAENRYSRREERRKR